MARKLFTTLGVGRGDGTRSDQRYPRTRYRWGHRECETEFFALALLDWLEPEKIYVFLTDRARRSANWTGADGLEQQLRQRGVPFEPVSIPDGRTEKELWQLFETVAQRVEPGDELDFDITHGFRSLPLVLLLAAVYLRAVRQARFRHLLYGALDAGMTDGTGAVFDLTPMLELLDWLAAADMFRKTGDARDLAGLLRRAQRRSPRDPLIARQATALKPFARVLDELSAALVTIRPAQAGRAAEDFSRKLASVRGQAGQHVPPLVPLLEQVEQTYRPLAAPDMAGYLALLDLYVQHGRIPQALLLARELVVEEACRRTGKDPSSRADRKEAEKLLNQHTGRRAARRRPTDPLLALEALWDRLEQARNDLAHCGFGRQAVPAETINEQTRRVVEELKRLLGGAGRPVA